MDNGGIYMKKNGFTLVEVVAVIVIIAVIGLVSIIAINRYIQQGYDEQTKIIRNTIVGAANNYRISHDMPVRREIQLSTLNSQEVYLEPINYKKGIVCPIDSTSGTIMLLGSTGTGLETVNDTYCIKFYCNNELIVNDYATGAPNAEECSNPR